MLKVPHKIAAVIGIVYGVALAASTQLPILEPVKLAILAIGGVLGVIGIAPVKPGAVAQDLNPAMLTSLLLKYGGGKTPSPFASLLTEIAKRMQGIGLAAEADSPPYTNQELTADPTTPPPPAMLTQPADGHPSQSIK